MANPPPIHHPSADRGPRVLRLSRELRFGLHEVSGAAAEAAGGGGGGAAGAANGFAGNPALVGIAPFLSLIATVAGQTDEQTGMLVNVKDIDLALRSIAVPLIRKYYYAQTAGNSAEPSEGGGGADVLLEIFHLPLEAGTFYTHAFLPHRLERLALSLSPFLSLAVDAKDSAMVELSLRFEFSAAHRLHAEALSESENRAIFGRCNNPNGHGHNYELEVTVAGAPDLATGQVMPIHLLQQIVNEEIIARFDHKHLNLDCEEFCAPGGQNPTVENIAAVLYGRLGPSIPPPAKLKSLRLWETPKTMCEIGG